MKKLLSLLKLVPILALLSVFNAQATIVSIGSTDSVATTRLFAGSTSWKSARTQILVTAAELRAAGAPSKGFLNNLGLRMYAPTAGDVLTMTNLTVKISGTTLTDLPSTWSAGPFTTVYSSAITQGEGLFYLPFSSPYLWNGDSSLILDICWNVNANTDGAKGCYAHTATGTKMRFYFSGSNACSTTGTDYSGPIRPNVKFDITPLNLTVKNSSPTPDAFLHNDVVYGVGQDQRPSVTLSSNAFDAVTVVKYKIVGPAPSTEVVYEALSDAANLNSVEVPVTSGNSTIAFSAAKGRFAVANTGALAFGSQSDAYGVYTVYASVKNSQSNNMFFENAPYKFIVAYNNDLAVRESVSPRDFNVSRYDVNLAIPVTIKYWNKGFADISAFSSNVKIFKGDVETAIYDESKTWTSSSSNTFVSASDRSLAFPDFNPSASGAGKYKMIVTSTLSGANDDNLSNNTVTSYFTVANDIEIEAKSIKVPGETLNIGKPVLPVATIVNNGVSDLAKPSKANLVIKRISDGTEVYNSNVTVETASSLPDGYQTTVNFNNSLVLLVPGKYQMRFSIDVQSDRIASNNVLLDTVTVTDGLAGVYTIGNVENAPVKERNFIGFQEAVAALYDKGMTGPIEFRITKSPIDVNSISAGPALDLSGYIAGNSALNTITFVACDSLKNTGNPAVINLNSTNGIGVLMGQNSNPSDANATSNNVGDSYKKLYSNAAGYITFDGGTNKSLKFNLNTANTRKIAFYLAQGASNNAIKNCQISDASNTANSNSIPKHKYNPAGQLYTFESDNTLSGAIVLRSIAPYNDFAFKKGSFNNLISLDTLVNKNNTIDNNQIDGFGYGIVSLGIGVLEKKNGTNFVHTAFNNTNNVISNNTIINSNYAGIFLGFNANTNVTGNVINNIGNSNVTDAAGIMVGGVDKGNFFGFNNVDVTINRNEISNVKATANVYGILNDQSLNSYFTSSGNVTFPKQNERVVISNNIVRSLIASNDAAERIGIAVQTSRNNLDVPSERSYRTKNNVVANNTVIMSADDMKNNAYSACFEIKQAANSKVVNNIFANIDNNDYNTNASNALISYVGQLPEIAGNVFERNIYYYNQSNVNDLARVWETDEVANIYPETGYVNEFKNLDQWQFVTNQDKYSYWYANTPNELIVNDKNQLRIKLTPEAPMNSKINNNGFLYREVLVDNNLFLSQIIEDKDIDGNSRGPADARYDIGASEFQGLVHLNDIEVMNITAPSSYKSANGEFSDVNYVMTEAPIEVKAMIRNNGNLPALNVRVKAVIYREFNDQANGATPMYKNAKDSTISTTYYKNINVKAYDNAEITFDLGDKQAPDFAPVTFFEKKNEYTNVPAKFATMVYNVTPRYRIEVSVENDQDNKNNTITKDYRFYLKKADLSILLSAENTNLDLVNTDFSTMSDNQFNNQVAGRLNFKAVNDAFIALGWKQKKEVEPMRPDYDVFDRTSWEPRAVNYNMYRTLFWADANDLDNNGVTRTVNRNEEADLRSFLANKSYSAIDWAEKKNLVIASQEILRNNSSKATFLANALKAVTIDPNSPLGANTSYSGNTVKGTGVGVNQTFTIRSTAFTKNGKTDLNPIPALMTRSNFGDGVSIPAFEYNSVLPTVTDKLAGVATSALTKNVVYLGADWRHWDNIEVLVRGIMDYTFKNGSDIVPVEIMDFDAIDRNNTVEIGWTTTFEHLTDRFEIERADVNEAGISDFRTIATEKAAGESKNTTSYGPVLDKEVKAGASYIYRLKAIDVTGETSYSDKVEVTIDANNTLNEITPNPVSANAEVSFNVNGEQNIEVSIYDVTGKKVKDVYTGIANGQKSITINVNDLVNGTYTVVMKSDKQVLSTRLYVRK
jgi:hypothetical protein